MKIHQVAQGSSAWLQLRSGIVTASELDNILDSKWEMRTGETPKSYMYKKLAEKWLGYPLTSFSGGSMEQGSIKEESAIPRFTWDTGIETFKVGFITTDDGQFGCSPDAMILNQIEGLECKSPEAHTMVKYLLANALPKEYAAQVHGSMYVTGAKYWYFMAYNPKFPTMILKIMRDAAIIEKIQDAVMEFNGRLAEAYDRLVRINGGEPSREAIETLTAPGVPDDALAEFMKGCR